MGIPFSFDKHPDRVVLMGENDSDHLSDAELKRILAGKVLMDGTTALKLTKRGFSDLIGCRAAEWTKATVSEERLNSLLNFCVVPFEAGKLQFN